MVAATGAGIVYFAIVFLAGVALGAVRTLAVAPLVGETAAVLIEAPLMLAVSWLAADWSARRFGVPGALPSRLLMGGAALALLMAAELAMSMLLFQRTLAQHIAAYRSAPGAVGLAAQVAFAAMPLTVTQRRPRRGGPTALS